MRGRQPGPQSSLADNPYGITSLAQLRDNANLGRLSVTIASGLRADGSCYEDLYAYGARSFSIWTADMKPVFDSGAAFERHIASVAPAHFNANHNANEADARSDDKGPEPEALAVAKLFGQVYAFIALERVGGVMIYDITTPYALHFVQYFNHRDFGAAPVTPAALDLGPEGLHMIEAEHSPIPGVPLLVVANEVSGTMTLFRIDRERLAGKDERCQGARGGAPPPVALTPVPAGCATRARSNGTDRRRTPPSAPRRAPCAAADRRACARPGWCRSIAPICGTAPPRPPGR